MYDVTNELTSIRRTRKTVNSMVWVIVGGAVFYSLMTSTPLVSAHSEWRWSGWALGILTDAAFVLSISADSVLSRHGIKGGRWPTIFRWATGVASLFLNTWGSVSVGDWVGVAIHSIAPAVLICAAEVAPIYRRKFRDLEMELTEQVTEVKVTRIVSRNRSQVQGSEVTDNEVTKAEVTSPGSDDELTENQRAIRDGYLNGLKAADVAKGIGVSPSYVSRQYKKIRQELALTA